MRVVSLLPSATEILFALGFDREIVGVSHECDFPPRARTKTIVIHSRIDKDAGPLQIDRQVREYVERGESLYAVDTEALQALAPDLIVTQDLCHVCAASPDDLASALAKFDARPEVLCLNPQDLGDVWRDILWVGEETGRGWQAEKLLKNIGERLGALQWQIEEAACAQRSGVRAGSEQLFFASRAAADDRTRDSGQGPASASKSKPRSRSGDPSAADESARRAGLIL